MDNNTTTKRSSTENHDTTQVSKRTRPTLETPELISTTLTCQVCLVQFKNQTRYRRHLIKTHKVKSQDIVLHSPELAPDTKYPNTYCVFCDIDMFKHDRYRQHLIGLHGLDIEMEDLSLVDGTVKPDPHDPDYYCMVCETTSTDKIEYCLHLNQEHNIKFKRDKIPFVFNSKSLDYDEEIPSTDDKNGTCTNCNHTYHSLAAYRRHLKEVHHMDDLITTGRRTLKQMKKMIKTCDFMPNPNDPNYYCRVCKVTLSKTPSLVNHIKVIHEVDVPFGYDYLITDPACIDNYPEYCHPHFSCQRCDAYFFETRAKFHDHLRTVHQVQLPNHMCGVFHCKNLAEGNQYKCLPCADGKTVRRRIFEIKPKTKEKNRETLVAKYIPPVEIDLESDQFRMKQAPTIHAGQTGGNMFSQPPPAQSGLITFEDLMASAAGISRISFSPEESSDDDDESVKEVKLEGGAASSSASSSSSSSSLPPTASKSKPNIAFCSICSISFKEPQEYIQHLNIHCVELKDARDGDIVEVHGYTCTTCHTKYDTKGRFIRHMSIAPHNNPSFDWMFQQKSNRQQLNNIKGLFKCLKCNLNFLNKKEHLDHLQQKHIQEIYRLKYLKSLVEDGTLFSMDGFYIECEDCDESYASLSTLKVHRQEVHTFLPDQETEVTRYHERQRQLGIPFDTHSCYECGISLPKNDQLRKEHVLLHRWDRLSWIQRDTWSGLLAVNDLRDINDFGIPAFYCGPCGRKFDDYPKYRGHVIAQHNVRTCVPTQKNHDPSIIPDIDDPRFYCKSCDFKFPARDKYRRHLKTFHEMLLPKLKRKSKNSTEIK